MGATRRICASILASLGLATIVQAQGGFDIHSDFLPVLRDARIDGTLNFRVPICSIRGQNTEPIWPITLKHVLVKTHGGVKSLVSVRGFRTSLAPFGKNQYIWTSPSGQDLPLDLSRQRKDGSACRVLLWSLNNDAILVTDGGWRLYYEAGYLRRALTDSGLMLRFYGRGPTIYKITTGSLFQEKELLTFDYIDPLRPFEVRCGDQVLRIEYDGESIQRVYSPKKDVDIGIIYEKELIAGVKIGAEAIPISWSRVPHSEISLSHLNPYGIVLKKVRDITYTVKATQAAVSITAGVGDSMEKMTGDNYSLTVKYEIEKR